MRKFLLALALAAVFALGIGASFVLDDDSSTGVQSTTQAADPAVLHGAINLMKPGFEGEASPAAIQLHNQLVNQGYYYKVTYDDGTERINRPITNKGRTEMVEFLIEPDGLTMDASLYGAGTISWYVICTPATNGLTINDFNQLLNQVTKASAKQGADATCQYVAA